jgi:hypothetical protein
LLHLYFFNSLNLKWYNIKKCVRLFIFISAFDSGCHVFSQLIVSSYQKKFKFHSSWCMYDLKNLNSKTIRFMRNIGNSYTRSFMNEKFNSSLIENRIDFQNLVITNFLNWITSINFVWSIQFHCNFSIQNQSNISLLLPNKCSTQTEEIEQAKK